MNENAWAANTSVHWSLMASFALRLTENFKASIVITVLVTMRKAAAERDRSVPKTKVRLPVVKSG